MSHGTYEEHAERIKVSREVALRLASPLAVLVDLSGPKIRTRSLKDGQPVELKKDQTFTITTREIVGNENEVGTNFSHLPDVVDPGTRILVDDGAIELVVESENETDVICRVIVGGKLSNSEPVDRQTWQAWRTASSAA